jgi:heme exporter protein CcmD
MSNHDFYLWMSYGVTAVALLVEVIMLRMRRAQALRHVEEERDLEAQD